MKHVTKGPFYNSLNLFEPKTVLSLLPTLQASAAEERALYAHSQRLGEIDVLTELSQKYSIQSEFKFLRDYFSIKSKNKEFHLLPLPYFNTDRDNFQDVVKRLTKEKFTKGTLKKFGHKTEEFGVTLQWLNPISPLLLIKKL